MIFHNSNLNPVINVRTPLISLRAHGILLEKIKVTRHNKKMNKMRQCLAVCLIQALAVLLLASCAQGAELPDDARQLLEKRDEAVKVIDRRLAEELEKLKVAYTKRGDLDSANAIVALIDKYKVDHGGQKDSLTQIARLAGVWKRDYDGSLFEFDAGGGGIWGGRDRFRVIYDPKIEADPQNGASVLAMEVEVQGC